MQTIRFKHNDEFKMTVDGNCTKVNVDGNCNVCSNRFEVGIVCAGCTWVVCEACSAFNKRPEGPKGLVYKCNKCSDPRDDNDILDKNVRSISSPAERAKLLYQVVDGDKHNWAWHFCYQCQKSTDPNDGVLCTVCNVFYCHNCNGGSVQRPCDSCVAHIAGMKKPVSKPQCESCKYEYEVCSKYLPPELKRLGVPSGGVRPKRS